MKSRPTDSGEKVIEVCTTSMIMHLTTAGKDQTKGGVKAHIAEGSPITVNIVPWNYNVLRCGKILLMTVRTLESGCRVTSQVPMNIGKQDLGPLFHGI